MNTAALAEWGAGLLLIGSGVVTLIASLGFVRLKDFYQRMHLSAMAGGLAAMLVLATSTLLLWSGEGRFSLHAFVIAFLISVTMPVFSSILARAALFRHRISGRDVPPSLTSNLTRTATPPSSD